MVLYGMAFFGYLKFGDNESGHYYREYNAVDAKVSVSREHSGIRPTGNCHCDSIVVTLVLPDMSDMFLYDWYIDDSLLSGSIVMMNPTITGDDDMSVIKFENSRCGRISEKYDIAALRRQMITLEIVPQKADIDDFKVDNMWVEE